MSADRFDLQFDYRFDTNNWFTAERRATLEAAASVWQNIIRDEFTNIPVGTQLFVQNPQTGQTQYLTSDAEIDDLVVFVGAQNFGGPNGTLALGGSSFLAVEGTELDRRRLGADFEPWTGQITFDSTERWFFDLTPDTASDIPANSTDFLSVAVHELGHILGFSSSANAFANLTQGGYFYGSAVRALNQNNPIPLDSDLSHIREGFTINGLGEALMSPIYEPGTRTLPKALDIAVLQDIGYSVDYSSAYAIRLEGSTVVERASGSIAQFKVTLAGPSLQPITVNYATVDGTSNNNDYLASSGTLTFNPGETSKTVDVLVLDDNWNEADESFDLLLSNSTNAVIANGRATALVTDTVRSAITTTLQPGVENLTLTGAGNITGRGNANDNVLTGNSGRNALYGGAGHDRLLGFAENDTLVGGAGQDTLIGGGGQDKLFLGLDWERDTVRYVRGSGQDWVNQFRTGVGGDVLSFGNIQAVDVVRLGSSSEFRSGDGIGGNAGFGTGELLLTLNNTFFGGAHVGSNIAPAVRPAVRFW
ncbi:Calx-beta domain-containing protein [Leptolyngbya sp. FACHB-261]|uniref:Calx-beta domain-containing protein n=1 Tax=Leptolyngbya sp. FACHB-261 TaxID=2692806 RepID=UPI001688C3C8|nr:Calx-beta domain-containing protein [Leptolyngbya sp. FACHB-261]MBD2104467.1 matrixin family metalloprotease [Leptolyngbya sp. FACHB-261]